MGVSFFFELLDPLMRRRQIIHEVESWQFIRRVNQIGQGTMRIPLDSINPRWASKDFIIVVWCSIDGAQPFLVDQTCWFITDVDDSLDDDILTLEFEDSIGLLNRRIIAYNAATSQAEKTAAADNLAKAIVRENMGTLADTARRYDATYFSISVDLSLAPSVTLGASRETVLPALQDIAAKSMQAGTFLAFDVVYTPSMPLDFRTYINQRGVDRRTGVSKVLIGPPYGNFSDGHVIYGWSNEVNAAYAGGQGEESERIIGLAVDTQRATLTPWARREGFINAHQAKTQAATDDAADRALANGQPTIALRGTIIDTPALRLGRHVNYGDKVVVEARRLFDARIDAISRSMDANGVYTASSSIETEQIYG